MSNYISVVIFLLYVASGIALQPGENSTACLAAPTDCTTVCTTIPNPDNKNPASNPLCYQRYVWSSNFHILSR